MDILDKQIKIKKFFKTVFRDIDFKREKIRVFQSNKDNTFNKVRFFNDIDELVSFSTNKSNYNLNTYFQLATLHIDAQDGKEENLKYRYCLSLDFDKKDLGEGFNHKDIVNRFKQNKIYCHAIINSGNGYHAYIMINKTNDIDKVNEVQKALCRRLGADKNAIKKTQILRIPYTYNVKGDKAKTVRIVHLEDRNSKLFRAYDINFLYEKNCIVKADDNIKNDTTIKYALNNTNMPKCIDYILKNGSEEGNRYKDLQNIVVFLRQRNKDLGTIKDVCKEWAIKSNYSDSLEYRVENIHNNKNSLELNCSQCEYQDDCYSKVISDFIYNDDKILTVSETVMGKLRVNNRKGVKVMKSNDLLVYSVLKNHADGLTIDEVMTELTYTKKKVIKNIALTEKYVRTALNNLEENGFIEIIKGNARQGIKNIYILKRDRAKIELTYNISYSATYECIKGNISTEELRLYNYMRYLHHKQQREDQKTLKGNLFQFNQIDLAKSLGVTQGRISQMIENLLDEKLLSIWYRQESKNNGFYYNIYRLNY